MTEAELAIVVKLKDMFSKQLDTIVASTDKAAVKMESSWKKITNGITTAKVAVAGWLTGQVAGFATDMVQLGAKVDRASVAFGTLAKGIRLDTTEAMAGLRAAASGTISDLELMTVANKAMLTGVAKSSEELERLVSTGRKLGGAMGLSSQEGIERLTQGLVSQQTESLRSIGITINLESAAKRLGVTLSDLTAEDRQGFFSREVWKVAAERMKTLGDNTSSVSTNVARMGAAWDNAKDKLASFIATAASPLLEAAARSLNLMTPAPNSPMKTESGVPYGAGGVFESAEAARRMLGAKAGPVGPTAANAEQMRRIEEMRKVFRESQAVEMEFAAQEMEAVTETAWAKFFANAELARSHADRVWEAMGAGVKDYYRTVSDTMLLVGDTVFNAMRNIEENIGSVFFDAMMGKMKTFKEYLRAFVTDIARTLSQMMARNAMAGLISSIGSAFGSTIGSVVGGVDAGVPVGAGGVHGYAYGGITTGTSIAGERGPEAVVPLPGSRSIPVEMRGGGGGGNVTYIINAIDTQSFSAALMGNKASIHRIVTEGLGMDTQLRAAARAV
jgi:hypothetical protein